MTQADIDALCKETQKWMWMAPHTSDKFSCNNFNNTYQVMVEWTKSGSGKTIREPISGIKMTLF
jgi:hypothetical protein